MKFFHFLPLAAFLFLALPQTSPATENLRNEPEKQLYCNLPAPTNVQYAQTTSTLATFNWNAVAAAWGYHCVLTNTATGASTANNTVSTNISFSVNPGDDYVFTVSSACSANNYSDATAQLNFKAEYIVIDLIAELNCPTDGKEIRDDDPDPSIWQYDWAVNTQYIIEFFKAGENEPEFGWVGLKLNANGHFEMRELVQNPGSALLCGLPIGASNGCQPAPITPGVALPVSNSTFSFGGRAAVMSMLSTNQLRFDDAPPAQPFDGIRIVEGCQSGNNFGGGGGGLGKPNMPKLDDPNMSLGTSLVAKTVNPFADRLTIRFASFPGEKIQLRMLDLQGKTRLQSNFDFENLDEQTITQNTGDIAPGLYFLILENENGQVSIQKVLKI